MAPLITGIDPSAGLMMSNESCASRARASILVVGALLAPP
jgi:hypothetical protein